MIKDKLQQLGFSPNEITVYLYLIENGKSRAGKIIELTGLHRNLVYTSLESLLKKKLVSKLTSRGVAEFIPNNPESILENVLDQEETAKEIIIELHKRHTTEAGDIQIFAGVEGIKRARNRVLNYPAGSEFYVLGATNLTSKPEMESFWKRFHKEREKKKISQKILYELSSDPLVKEGLAWRNSLPLSKARFLPFNIDSPFWFDFIDDLLNIGLMSDNPITISVKDKKIVEGFKKYFNYFWNQRTITKTGLDAVEEAIYDQLNALKPGEHYYVLGALGKDYPPGFHELYDKFHTERIKKGVITKMLCFQESYDNLKEKFAKCGDPEGKVSFLRKYINTTPIPMQINIYNNKIFFILYEKVPTVISFDNPIMAESFKNYFDNIWQQETYTLQGPEALQKIWFEALDTKELRLIGARGYFIDYYPELFKKIEAKAKNTPGIIWRNIVDRSVQGHAITKYPWSRTKYNLSKIGNPNVVWLYGKKLVIANWADKKKPIFFISENEHLVQSYNDYFEELWKQ
ncbi:MAG: Transcriptional regulator, TrmB [Parcubacteria group bacterium GW2011_GWC2_39_14]|nr:MAG: Transcriptional regulator, TrmB [Parcubacteria group bacterium GW2011_GWC2_39_14]KKR55284.1 MAG: Transcriptional regulator, TrmB [Parcubacteria group bacterium GW2011_GWA2_40_23]